MTITIKNNGIVSDSVAIRLVHELWDTNVQYDQSAQEYTMRDAENIEKVIAVKIGKNKNGVLVFEFGEK